METKIVTIRVKRKRPAEARTERRPLTAGFYAVVLAAAVLAFVAATRLAMLDGIMNVRTAEKTDNIAPMLTIMSTAGRDAIMTPFEIIDAFRQKTEKSRLDAAEEIAPAAEPELEPETAEPEQADAKDALFPFTEEDIVAMCQTVYGEALITKSDMHMSAVVWCALNRVDSDAYPDTVEGVVTQYRQFHGYDPDNPVTEHIEWLVRDVFARYLAEKDGEEDVGRTLPADYLFFYGDGRYNHFTTRYHAGSKWDWSLPNPYET